jgi:hypothetical protein
MPAIHPSCHALSSRNANRQIRRGFLHETFSRSPRVRLVIHKIAVFPRENRAGVYRMAAFSFRPIILNSDGKEIPDVFCANCSGAFRSHWQKYC